MRKADESLSACWHRSLVDFVVLDNRTLSEAARLLGNLHRQRVAERLETGLDLLADFCVTKRRR